MKCASFQAICTLWSLWISKITFELCIVHTVYPSLAFQMHFECSACVLSNGLRMLSNGFRWLQIASVGFRWLPKCFAYCTHLNLKHTFCNRGTLAKIWTQCGSQTASLEHLNYADYWHCLLLNRRWFTRRLAVRLAVRLTITATCNRL